MTIPLSNTLEPKRVYTFNKDNCHIDIVKAKKKIFIAGQWQYGEFAQFMQSWDLLLFVFYTQSLYPGCHTSINKQNYRGKKDMVSTFRFFF